MRYRLAVPLLCCWLMHGAESEFRTQTLATDLSGGYQVVAADLNKDGRPDLIALASGMSELLWFENLGPKAGWRRHVLATGVREPINLAANDIDGDGIPEIVISDGFAMDPRKSTGRVMLLEHRGDPREPWKAKEIDRLPSTHRLRWADIDGSGRKVVVSAPLAGASAEPPEYRAACPLVFYRPGEWKREVIPDPVEGVLHGIHIVDWDGDGRDEILTASFEGIHLFKLAAEGRWRRDEIAKGSPELWPKSGASDVDVGRLGKRRVLCSIEPWHGNEVVVYTEERGAWRRNPIEAGLEDGHALGVVDIDADGRDEVIAGCRRGPRSVFIYRAEDADGKRWTRKTLDDGGMAAASCAVADLNGDGKPEIACIDGRALKVYERVNP